MNLVEPGENNDYKNGEERKTDSSITIEIKKEMVDNLFDQMLTSEKLRKTDSSKGGQPALALFNNEGSYNPSRDTLQKALDRHFIDAGTPFGQDDDLFDKISMAKNQIDEIFRNATSIILKTNKKNSFKTMQGGTDNGSFYELQRPNQEN